MLIAWMWIKKWAYAIGGAALGVLGLASVYYKRKSNKLGLKADTLEATVHAERVRKKIEKKKKEELSRRESEIKEEIKNEKTADNLTDSNNW